MVWSFAEDSGHKLSDRADCASYELYVCTIKKTDSVDSKRVWQRIGGKGIFELSAKIFSTPMCLKMSKRSVVFINLTDVFRHSRTSYTSKMFAKEFRQRERLYFLGQGERSTWTGWRIFRIQSRQKIKLEYEYWTGHTGLRTNTDDSSKS